jgi:hypothetical protein
VPVKDQDRRVLRIWEKIIWKSNGVQFMNWVLNGFGQNVWCLDCLTFTKRNKN